METKLTATELMIGDWVIYNPNVFIEDEYEPYKEPYLCRIESGEQIDDAVNECYSPIPLTAKVLYMNFERKVYNDYAYYELDDNFCVRIVYGEMFLARWDDDELSVYQSPHAILRLNYVHEFQHALRLCGINDKEIVL